ncbi:uncharacterized protein LOC110440486 [Mizuhopecten yessoensis]|uniref:Protein phosphatase 1 regulatory subunit 35 C-terminal domain-containing protein n=1 Tax=Mizuhopecten yessoensis TaxID=6573 RepID=A0A210PL20_MIZYE|nr:uncharacterized protein LOC110440486 [Mizuhopecten yessoensis]XP_021339271.1 uncharacterized protein LOC110440486 [Mizuhopecten yessoensis]OWF37175.1 hypothetical protein KP79_PYT21308 [Mizuhopecten yessoensis]
MATHFACQPTEPLAHKYPLVQKVEKSHGAVSRYEVLYLEDKMHTRFPPPGWDTSQSSEESIPLCQAPAPWNEIRNLIGPDPALCISPDKSLSNQKQRHNKPMYPIPKQHMPEQLIGPDPDLCITPEKPSGGVQKSNLKQDNEDYLKAKNQHRVRFELENSLNDSDKENLNDSVGKSSGSGKTYKPSAYGGSEEYVDGISEVPEKTSTVSSNKPRQYAIRQEDQQTVYVPLPYQTNTDKVQIDKSAETYYSVLPTVLPKSENDIGKEIVVKTTKPSKKNSKNVLSETSKRTAANTGQNLKQTVIAPEVKHIATVPKRKVRVTRESKDQFSNDYKFPFSEEGETALEYEHVFTRPEYNSTLRMKTELEHIRGCEVDVEKALERKLQTSNKKQTEIREKAASRVNQADEEFAGLVSLHIPVDNLRSQVEKEKTSRVKSSQVVKSQVYKDRKEPDLMELFTPDLQKEYPELSVPGLSTPTESLSTASQRSAFDLYRHNRVWEGTSNFRGSSK